MTMMELTSQKDCFSGRPSDAEHIMPEVSSYVQQIRIQE